MPLALRARRVAASWGSGRHGTEPRPVYPWLETAQDPGALTVKETAPRSAAKVFRGAYAFIRLTDPFLRWTWFSVGLGITSRAHRAWTAGPAVSGVSWLASSASTVAGTWAKTRG